MPMSRPPTACATMRPKSSTAARSAARKPTWRSCSPPKPRGKQRMRASMHMAALDAVADRLKQDPAYRTPARYVRVNQVGSERLIEDLKAVVRPGLEGLVVPKVDTVEQVRIVEDELGRAEVARHMPGGTVKLLV